MKRTAERSHHRVDLVVVAAVTVVAVGLLYARLPFAARQLWAEDGRDFLGDAMEFGAIRSLGHSQAGYYLTVSRLGGVLASLMPLRDAALVMWLWVAAVVAWLVATVTVSSRTWLRTWPARVVVALALVLLPVLGQESIGNAANLQFVLLFGSLVVLISRSRGRFETVNGCILLVATGLTTPVALVLAPFAALRMAQRRSWRPDAYVIWWAAGVAVQWIAIAITRPDRGPRQGDTVAAMIPRLEVFGVERNLFPIQLDGYRGPIFAVVFAVLVAIVAGLAWWQGQRLRSALLVLVPAVGVGTLILLGWSSGSANRYLVFTGLCFVWTAMAGTETVAALAPSSWHAPTIASALVAGFLLLTFAANRAPSDLRISGPTWHAAIDTARAECQRPEQFVLVQTAPVRPEKPFQWYVRVECRDLD